MINLFKRGKSSYIDYSSNSVPRDYKCGSCGVTNCKLWREYSSFPPILLECVNCAFKSQSKPGISSLANFPTPEVDNDGRYEIPDMPDFKTDSIGWRVPAIPDEEDVGYWGYTSVPQEGINWWKRLPTYPKQ